MRLLSVVSGTHGRKSQDKDGQSVADCSNGRALESKQLPQCKEFFRESLSRKLGNQRYHVLPARASTSRPLNEQRPSAESILTATPCLCRGEGWNSCLDLGALAHFPDQNTILNFNLSCSTISSFLVMSSSISQGQLTYLPANHSLRSAANQVIVSPGSSG